MYHGYSGIPVMPLNEQRAQSEENEGSLTVLVLHLVWLILRLKIIPVFIDMHLSPPPARTLCTPSGRQLLVMFNQTGSAISEKTKQNP